VELAVEDTVDVAVVVTEVVGAVAHISVTSISQYP